MKLRIRGDSIRLRLKRSEVDCLAAGTSVIEQTRLPNGTLTYTLGVSDSSDFSASFDEGKLAVRVPKPDIAQWAETDQVSMYAEESLGTTGTLALLVEKDFNCLAPGGHRSCEDDSDTFPHPDE